MIAGLARAHAADIERAAEAVRDAERPRIHTFISTSDIHIEHQLQSTREDVKGEARAAVAHAKSFVDDVEFSPMDATRADVEFIAEVLQIAIDEGATTINIPDTVGYATPDEYAAFLTRLYELVPGLRDVVLSVHCHDDLGLAVANSLAGVQRRRAPGRVRDQRHRRARRQRVARGDRDAAARRAADYRAHDGRRHARDRPHEPHGRAPHRLPRAAQQGDRRAQRVRPRVRHPPGRRAQGAQDFEIMDARTIGLEGNDLVLGKHSGRHALRSALEELGFQVDGQALNTAFKRFKEIADRKKTVTAMDLEALVTDELRDELRSYTLEWFDVDVSNRRPPHARVAVRTPEGEEVVGDFTGDGPVDAIFRAINAATKREARLREFRIDAVTGGQDALGEASVVLELAGLSASGQGVSTDIIEAAA